MLLKVSITQSNGINSFVAEGVRVCLSALDISVSQTDTQHQNMMKRRLTLTPGLCTSKITKPCNTKLELNSSEMK